MSSASSTACSPKWSKCNRYDLPYHLFGLENEANTTAVKVLLVIRSLNVGGAERQVVTLSHSLFAAGHSVDVAIFSSGGTLENELLKIPDIKLHVLARRKFLGVIGFALQIRKLTKKNRYDSIYSFLPIPNLAALGVKGLRNRPKIVWGVRSSNLNLDEYPPKVRRSMRLEKFFSRRADCIVSNSYAAKSEYVDAGYPSDKFTTLHNAIDTDRFHPDSSAIAETKRELDIPDAAIVIGIFARVHPKKDHGTFLNAAATHIQAHPNTYFLCVGGNAPTDADLVDRQKDLADKLGIVDHVRWLGERSDPERLMNACTLTTLSSSSGEGFPNSVAESAACGIPCVATDSGDAKEIITDPRFVVKPGDPLALSNAWAQILIIPKPELNQYKQNLRESIIDRFSSDVIAKRLISIVSNQ
jgi:glycosyltransferase involved in cell wall biosynthesis